MTVEVFASWRTWEDAEPRLSYRLRPATLSVLQDAFEFASAWHGEQRRPTDEPYTWHLLQVLEVLVEGTGVTDRDVLVAAILHDVVEDTPCSLRTIGSRFGARAAELVGWLTKDAPTQGEDESTASSRYFPSLASAPTDAVLVKLADRVSNVQRLDQHPSLAFQRRYYRETIDHIIPLAHPWPWFRRWYEVWRERFRYLGR